jgi:hypothetical protein
VDTYLVKHHQNSEAELLQYGVLEQSSSRVEQSHVKHALTKGDCVVAWADSSRGHERGVGRKLWPGNRSCNSLYVGVT